MERGIARPRRFRGENSALLEPGSSHVLGDLEPLMIDIVLWQLEDSCFDHGSLGCWTSFEGAKVKPHTVREAPSILDPKQV